MNQWQFGLVIDHAAAFKALPARLPAVFTALRVSSEAVEGPAAKKKLRAFGIAGLELDHLAARTVCRMAPEAQLRLKLDFLEQFKRHCRQAVELDADRVVAAFDLDRTTDDTNYRAQLRELLLGCCGVLEPLPLQLLLKIRLPLPPAIENAGVYDRFLRELPGGKLGLSVEAHPHEPAFAALGAEATRPIGFMLEDMCFVYEPATGNRLTAKALMNPLTGLAGRNRPIRIFFDPAGIDPDALPMEINELAALANEIGKVEKC